MNPSKEKIYLDYAATTPVDTRVMEAMLPYFEQVFGNTSSIHIFGQQAEAALERFLNRAEQRAFDSGGDRFTRDELHERH